MTMRTGYSHHGIYVGRGRVVHYRGLAAGFSSGPVEIVPLENFTNNHGFVLVQHPNPKFSKKQIVRRALSKVGEDKYDVTSNNCEHFAFWAIEDYHHSNQVAKAAPLATSTAAAATGLLARGVVVASGTVAGLSGSAGMMSGLATLGGAVGAGAIGGIGILGGAGGAAAASLLNKTALKDDPNLPHAEQMSRRRGRKASYAGAALGTAGGVASVAAAGVPGLSAVGITSGLSSVGSIVGGGMAAGIAITTAMPVIMAIALGFGVYKFAQSKKKSAAKTKQGKKWHDE